MDNWIPKNQTLRFAVLAASLSILLYFLGLFLIVTKTKEAESFYWDSESEFSKNERLAAIRSITETNGSSIEALRGFFIQKGDEVEFIEQIESLARRSSIKFEIGSIDVKADPADKFKEDIAVKMDIEGGWRNLSSFIGGLERMPFGVLIRDVDLRDRDDGEWTGSIELVVFREK